MAPWETALQMTDFVGEEELSLDSMVEIVRTTLQVQRPGDEGERMLPDALSWIAVLCQQRGDARGAKLLMCEAVRAQESVCGATLHESVISLRQRHVRTLIDMKELCVAEKECNELVQMSIRLYGGRQDENVANALEDLALVKMELGQSERSLRLYLEALAIKDAARGTRRNLASAATLCAVGATHLHRKELDEALVAYRESLDIQSELLGSSVSESLVATLSEIGDILRIKGDYDGALQHLLRALPAQVKLSQSKESPEVAVVIVLIAGVLREKNDYTGAIRQLRKALRINEEAFKSSSCDEVLEVRGKLVTVLTLSEDYCDAVEECEKLLDGETEQNGTRECASVGLTLAKFASILHRMGKYENAITAFEEALRVQTAAAKSRWNSMVVQTLEGYASTLDACGRSKEALDLLLESHKISKFLGRQDSLPEMRRLLGTIACAKLELGDKASAMEDFAKLFKHGKVDPDGINPVTVLTWKSAYATLLQSADDFKAAEALYKEVIAEDEQGNPRRGIFIRQAIHNYGLLRATRGEYKEAAALLFSVLEKEKESKMLSQRNIAEVQLDLAKIHVPLGDHSSAIELAGNALDSFKAGGVSFCEPTVLFAMEFFGQYLLRGGFYERAVDAFLQVLAVKRHLCPFWGGSFAGYARLVLSSSKLSDALQGIKTSFRERSITQGTIPFESVVRTLKILSILSIILSDWDGAKAYLAQIEDLSKLVCRSLMNISNVVGIIDSWIQNEEADQDAAARALAELTRSSSNLFDADGSHDWISIDAVMRKSAHDDS